MNNNLKTIKNYNPEVVQRFINWLHVKIELHFSSRIIYFYERQIWWASIGQNIGSEQNGKSKNFERPVLILKKFSSGVFWGLPISTQLKSGVYNYQFSKEGKKFNIVLSQIRLLSSKRLLRKIGNISNKDFELIKEKLRSLV